MAIHAFHGLRLRPFSLLAAIHHGSQSQRVSQKDDYFIVPNGASLHVFFLRRPINRAKKRGLNIEHVQTPLRC